MLPSLLNMLEDVCMPRLAVLRIGVKSVLDSHSSIVIAVQVGTRRHFVFDHWKTESNKNDTTESNKNDTT